MDELKEAYELYVELLTESWGEKSAIDKVLEILEEYTVDVSVTYNDGKPSYIFYKEYLMFLFSGIIYKRV